MSFALLGVGGMGRGIARNVISKAPGKRVVLCDTRSEALAAWVRSLAAEGLDTSQVQVTEDPSWAIREANIISLSLPSQSASESVLFGQGALMNMRDSHKKLVVEHSTLSKDYVVSCHRRLTERGVAYIDAPVSGGPQGALAGSLSIMVGGDEEVLQRAVPWMQLYAHKILRMGGPGCGMAAKLVNQALVGAHAQAACEAIRLAHCLGLRDMTQVRELLAASWGQSKVLDLVLQDFITAAATSEDLSAALATLPTAAPLRNMDKDLRFLAELEADLPVVAAAARGIKEACAGGLQDAPFAALYAPLARK